MSRIALLAALLALPACKKAEAPTEQTCVVRIRATPTGEPIRARAQGPTEETARAAALAAACPKLPAALHPHCRDPERVAAATVVAWHLEGDQRAYEATVTLREAAPIVVGEANSPEGLEVACDAALLAACANAGAEGHCVRAGTHTVVDPPAPEQ